MIQIKKSYSQARNEISYIETAPANFETVLKSKLVIYQQNKHLVEELFAIEEKPVLKSFQYLWNNNGKKIRFIAALLIQDLFLGTLKDEVIKIGGLIELLHSASLIIDDIQDGSVERRGKPCTHTIHGIDSSINAANLIYYLPANRLINSLSNLELKCEISEIYMNAMVGLHIGQGLDIAVHKIEKKEDLPSTNQYLKFASLKTGELMKMLVRMVGAVLKVDQEGIRLLAECMSNVGIAYQIVDDVLNVSNSQSKMGKGIIAEDLHERKFSLIIDMLRENQEFMKLFFIRQKSEDVVGKLLKIIEESGVLPKCLAKANQYADKAYSCIEQLKCPGSKLPFTLFIKFIVERKN